VIVALRVAGLDPRTPAVGGAFTAVIIGLPLEVQELLDENLQTPVRSKPQITLEEIDGDEVVVRIAATPERVSDGPRLASEVLEAVAGARADGDG
jgi:hypothetical protein